MPVTSTSSSGASASTPALPFAVGADSGTDPKVTDVRERLAAAYLASGAAPEKAQAKLDAQGKLYVRDP